MATIQMDSQKVIKAAETVIAKIMAHRENRDETAIARKMASRSLGWRGFYWPTREQAIKALDNSDCWGWRSIYAWGDLDHAKKLLLLAQHGDPVTLNEEDIIVLAKGLK
jgi:hypothetical protein